MRALFTMIVCYAIGLVIGLIAQSTVQRHIEQHKLDHPIPGEEMDLAAVSRELDKSSGNQAQAEAA
ncbi:hypothetical protein [Algisphaera agarilytica]|uniref:Uncharacterized protein n=1 Tax=Algisphaera agarilytica TaxID=1385975 RepID=A0A7X0H7N1_9BACT|nr:hypothetical protein [Algisphaera agarilytica]MBB6430759.1 hypothetical protein [Algisphaera agarilytica]